MGGDYKKHGSKDSDSTAFEKIFLCGGASLDPRVPKVSLSTMTFILFTIQCESLWKYGQANLKYIN